MLKLWIFKRHLVCAFILGVYASRLIRERNAINDMLRHKFMEFFQRHLVQNTCRKENGYKVRCQLLYILSSH